MSEIGILSSVILSFQEMTGYKRQEVTAHEGWVITGLETGPECLDLCGVRVHNACAGRAMRGGLP
jgi:hypothetical protein